VRRVQEAFGPFGSGQRMQVGIACHYVLSDDKIAFLETSHASKHSARSIRRFIPKRNSRVVELMAVKN